MNRTSNTVLKPWFPTQRKLAMKEEVARDKVVFLSCPRVYSKHSTNIWRRHLHFWAPSAIPGNLWPLWTWVTFIRALPQAAQPPPSPSSPPHQQVLLHIKSPIPNPIETARPFVHSINSYYTTYLLYLVLISGNAAINKRPCFYHH